MSEKLKRAAIGGAAVTAIAIALTMLRPRDHVAVVAPNAVDIPEPVAHVTTAPAPEHVTSSRELPPNSFAKDGADQTAHGKLHLSRDGDGATSVDLEPRYALTRWQPGDHKLRVVLTERALSSAETAHLAAALASPGIADLTDAHAVLELTFAPTAQAFDRDDLDTAVLTVTDTSGASATADILGSLQWHGSLLSPESAAAGGARSTQFELTAASQDTGTESRQSWHLDIDVPVTLAD